MMSGLRMTKTRTVSDSSLPCSALVKILTLLIAENYYTADYPDEDLDSGDEYGRGAYNYRGNASDQEEFDERDDEGYVMDYGNEDNDEAVLPTAHMGLQPPSAFR